MWLRLSSFLKRILVHSVSGNSGGPSKLRKLHLVNLILTAYCLNKKRVCSSSGHNDLCLRAELMAQVNLDGLEHPYLYLGSSLLENEDIHSEEQMGENHCVQS